MTNERQTTKYECGQCHATVEEDDIVCPECGTNLITDEDMESIHSTSPSGLGYLVAFVVAVALIMLIAKALGTS